MTAALRVIKLGGSLLDWPEWPRALGAWLSAQPPAIDVLVVGGGTIVDQVRELDRRHRLSPEAAHWLAIRAMGVTAALACELLPDAKLVTALDRIERGAPGALQILVVEQALRDDHDSEHALPCDWQVTSDSIAARVAILLRASELVLLKSTMPPPGTARETWSATGFVDSYFTHASRDLPVRCVNLRAPNFPQLAGA